MTNFNSPSNCNEASSQMKEESLVVKIRDALTGEVTIQKMQPDRVWNLEKNKKVMVELNGDGQGSDNGSNLLVRFLGKLSQKSVFCPISVERWDRMPEEKTRLEWQVIEKVEEYWVRCHAGMSQICNGDLLASQFRFLTHLLQLLISSTSKEFTPQIVC